jgi:hypothetical protein
MAIRIKDEQDLLEAWYSNEVSLIWELSGHIAEDIEKAKVAAREYAEREGLDTLFLDKD